MSFILYFVFYAHIITSVFPASYGESSEHESEESSDDDVSIGKRKGKNGSGMNCLKECSFYWWHKPFLFLAHLSR